MTASFVRTIAFIVGTFLTVSLAGCSSPTHPSVSVASGRPVSPTNGTQFSYYSQPITLVVANGVATGGASPITAVEVATDAEFAAVVTTQIVSPDAKGQLTITLGHLSPATTYYWRVKTTPGDNASVYSSSASFSIGPLLVIQSPVPVLPLSGSFQHKRPTFTVANAARTGPAATVRYRFEVATDASFGALVASGSAAEGKNQTSFTPAVDLASGASYVWRAQASDTVNGVTSGYSAAQAFMTVNPPDDGSYPYTLDVHLPQACVMLSIWFNQKFTLDSLLTVTGDSVRFFVPDLGQQGFDFAMQRAGNHVSGLIAAGLVSRGNFELIGNLAGMVDTRGRFTGTFNGEVSVDSPSLIQHVCKAPGVTWTLTPR
jgi:hypothetical protein